MKRLAFSLFLIISTTSLLFAGEWKTYGAGVKSKELTKISDIYASPEKYVGKTVVVEGRIVDVCKKRGCWMEIASDKEFQTIRVKVKDGEIVFPLEAKGHLGKIEGVVEKLEYSKEQMIKSAQHHAEETGEEFDPSTITEGKVIYRLRGLGAEINLSN